MTSYSITHNSHMLSFTAHLQDSNLLSLITQCLTPNLQFQFVPITFVQFAHTIVLIIILPSNACQSTAKCVT